MIRGSGKYTTYRGRTWRVSGRTDLPQVRIIDDFGDTTVMETVGAEQVGRIEKVATTAAWRGAHISVGDVLSSGTVGFYTDDRELAEREGLPGDRYSGWRGKAPISELEDVREAVTVLREAGWSA